jgi:hypothetical protein
MVLGVEGFAGGVADEIAGEVAAAVGVNFLAKPEEEGLVIALVEMVLQVGKIPLS